MRHIGIDLGTSNSLIAEVIVENNSISISCLKNNENKYSFPSVLSYVDREDRCLFGEKAELRLLTHPKSTISMIKTRLGECPSISVEINGKLFNKSPQEISATLLRQLTFRYGDKLNRAVITKPANYSANQNKALKDIIDIADFDVVDLIEEPSSAVMYHLFSEYSKGNLKLENYNTSKNILCFDFGGGTLDLSLVSVENKENGLSTKVLCNEGNCMLGGELIDLMFERVVLKSLLNFKNDDKLKKIIDEFEIYYNNFISGKPLSFNLSATEEEIKFIYEVKKIVEKGKIELSTNNETTIKIKGYADMVVSRDDFENYILNDYGNEIGIRDKIKDIVSKIALVASKKNLKLYQVVFVGGTSNIPYIRNLVKEELESLIVDYNEDSVFISDEYDRAVVKGAAILCAIKDGIKIPPFNNEVCRTIVSRKIEIDYFGNKYTVVNEGEEYPFVIDKVVKLKIKNALAPYQTIYFNEVEEYADGTTESKRVLNFNFYLPIYYTNDDLTLKFNIDKNGLYKMHLVYENLQDEIDFEHKFIGSLTSDEMARASKIVGRLK